MGFPIETSSLLVHLCFAVFSHHYLYCCVWQQSWKYNLLYAKIMSKKKLQLHCRVKYGIHSLALCSRFWIYIKLEMMVLSNFRI